MAEFSTSRGGFGVRQLLLYVAPNQAKRGIWFDTVTCKYASAQGKKGGGWGWCQYTIIRTGGYRASPVEYSPFPDRDIDFWADNCGYISTGRYICTHTGDKYAHTHMNVSLVSVYVHIITVWARVLVQRKICCRP